MPFFKKCDQNVDIRGSDTDFDKLSNHNSLVIEKALAESTTAFLPLSSLPRPYGHQQKIGTHDLLVEEPVDVNLDTDLFCNPLTKKSFTLL